MPKSDTEIEIFKAGTHIATSGETMTFSAADLAGIAGGYDVGAHEAPIVVGHPKQDHPAYGWIKSVRVDGDRLVADASQVDPQFAELVKSGRFKKVSAAFYRPDDTSNPKPGAFYLRHVGFLGAEPPAVKGLKQVTFAAGETFITFGEVDDGFFVRSLRKLRDYIVSRDGIDVAENVLPSDDLDAAAHQAAQPDTTEDDPDMNEAQFAEQQRQLDERKRKLETEEAEMKKRKEALDAQGATFSERERTQRAAEIGAFVDGLVKEGRMLPAMKPGLVAFMEALPAKPLEFAEADGSKKSIAPLDHFKNFLGTASKVITFGEAAKHEDATRKPRFTFAPGAAVDRDRLQLHEKALAYSEQHKVDYVTAVRAVGADL